MGSTKEIQNLPTKIGLASQSIVRILSSIFIFFFAYTGFYKVMNMEAFKFNIIRTAIFPEEVVNVIPYLVVGLELTVILFLIFRTRIGLYLFALSMFFFTNYIIGLYITGRYEVCGCGGVLNGLEFQYHLIINIVFFILAILSISLNRKIRKP